MIIQQEYVDDKLSWFAINLYLSKFIRLVIYPEIQMLWPILLRTTVLPTTLEYCTRLLNVLCVTIRRILDQLKNLAKHSSSGLHVLVGEGINKH